MRNASQEDCQLLAESEILQRDLFVAAKDQKDHSKKREDCVQHETGSVSTSSLKINRLRDRWDLARDRRSIQEISPGSFLRSVVTCVRWNDMRIDRPSGFRQAAQNRMRCR